MGEIFTINLGYSGNFSSAYFWQIQDMYEHGPEFHKPLFVQSAQGYFPRMLGIDIKESLSFPQLEGETEILWHGKIQTVKREEGVDEKWTDLLMGMVSPKNLVPVYSDESPAEEIEEKIRWFSEISDKLEGIHALQDCVFGDFTVKSLEILEEFYPKIPVLLFSLNFSYSEKDEFMVYKLSEFSSLLHLPCTRANSKLWFSRLGAALDTVSYKYRVFGEMSGVFRKFMCNSSGNTANIGINSFYFNENNIVSYEEEFTRGEGSFEKIPVPLNFPYNFSGESSCKLLIDDSITNFYSNFISKPSHHTLIDEYLEARNYILHLQETYDKIHEYF